jgi:two-component system, cell cycle response regulator DivK
MFLKHKRVFVVEDDAANLAVISVILRQAGATVQFDRWGKDSQDNLHNFLPVDVILLDLMLPNGITGYDVFDVLRTVPGVAHIPIVAVTAADPDTELAKVRAKGFKGYISKPIRIGQFDKHIAAIIGGQEVWLP